MRRNCGTAVVVISDCCIVGLRLIVTRASFLFFKCNVRRNHQRRSMKSAGHECKNQGPKKTKVASGHRYVWNEEKRAHQRHFWYQYTWFNILKYYHYHCEVKYVIRKCRWWYGSCSCARKCYSSVFSATLSVNRKGEVRRTCEKLYDTYSPARTCL